MLESQQFLFLLAPLIPARFSEEEKFKPSMSNNEEKCSSEYGESQEPLLEDSMFERQRKPWFPHFWARVSFGILLLYTVASVPVLVISRRSQMPRPYCKFGRNIGPLTDFDKLQPRQATWFLTDANLCILGRIQSSLEIQMMWTKHGINYWSVRTIRVSLSAESCH